MSREQTDDLTARLADHPWIAATSFADDVLRVRPARAAVAVRPSPGPLITEFLEHWGEVYDFTYATGADQRAGDLDLSGWRASDTGEPFPAGHMADWVDRTVELVLAGRPRWVLELGCGTGMLADRLRPHLAGYVGTDVAESALGRLAPGPSIAYLRAAAHEVASPAVRAAMEHAGFPGGRPDCVLVNSVTQHFPNVAYLTAVVVDALRLLTPGGALVVGDVRHAGLMFEHCRWIEAAADPHADPAVLAERARARAARDDELTFDPATLAAAAASAGRPVVISLHPKGMRADTELTRYRFDTVLRVTRPSAARVEIRPWSGLGDLLSAVSSGSPVRVEAIPNGLLAPAGVTARELLDALTGRDATVLLDARDPTALAVAAPASSAAVAVTDLAGLPATAHEPFTAFLARRLGEVVRRTVRRERPGTPVPPVAVDPDPFAAIADVAEAAVDSDAAQRLPGFLDRLDRVALLAMAATLGRGGVVAERHRWIVRRWRAALAAAGMLGDGDPRPVHRSEVDDAASDVEAARVGLGYPAELIRFFRTAIQYLPELLRDEVSLQTLLFADGETGTAQGAYRDNPVNRYLNAAAAGLIRAHAGTIPAGRPVRVLEVGAGVGATTADVLAALAHRTVDYLFTDVSRFFLAEGRDRFPGLRFALFDINDSPAAQGMPLADRDVVLGANVLHNASDIRATLRGLRDLLVPGGLLVFVETTREIPHILTSMQFLMSARPGHDRPGARDLRAGTDRIFLSTEEWTTELTEAGLHPQGSLPDPGHPLHRVGVQLFAARAPR